MCIACFVARYGWNRGMNTEKSDPLRPNALLRLAKCGIRPRDSFISMLVRYIDLMDAIAGVFGKRQFIKGKRASHTVR